MRRRRGRLFPLVTNHRGRPVGAWLGAPLAAAAAAGLAVVRGMAGGQGAGATRLLAMIGGCLAAFAAGWYDDRRPARTRGMVRQLALLWTGTLTSGVVKLVVIVAASAAVASALGARGLRLALAVPVLAAAANTWNLLDVAPGRALKLFVPVAAALALLSPDDAFRALAASVLVVALAALVLDVRERAMLGDAGSNLLGFVVGLGMVVTLSPPALALALLALLAVHAASETVTLSRLIRGVPVLRWFDDLGRIPLPGSSRPDPPSDSIESRGA